MLSTTKNNENFTCVKLARRDILTRTDGKLRENLFTDLLFKRHYLRRKWLKTAKNGNNPKCGKCLKRRSFHDDQRVYGR